MDRTPRSIRTKRVQAIERRFHKPLADILRKLSWEDRLSYDEIAAKLEVPAGTIGGWMVRFGIDRTTLVEQAVAGAAAKELAS